MEEYIQDPQPLKHTKIDLSKKYACHICPERYSSQQSLDNHLAKNHSKHYKCNLCYAYFNLEDSEKFKYHVFTHEKKGQSGLECVQCGEKFDVKIMLKRHLAKKGQFHNENCAQCGDQMKSFTDYQSHVRENHENKWIYKCGHCSEIFIGKVSH